MDLRQQPGKIQKFLEFVLRMRLIFLLILVLGSIPLVISHFHEMLSMPVAASESLGMWIAEFNGIEYFWESLKYLVVSFISLYVLTFVFGGPLAGISAIISSIVFLLVLYILGGSETMVLPFYGIVTLFGLILLLFVKKGFSYVLFPFMLNWILFTAILSLLPLFGERYIFWAIFSTLSFSLSIAFSFTTNKILAMGSPQTGALIQSGRRFLMPVVLSSLLFIVALFIDMNSLNVTGEKIFYAFILWAIFILWFYLFFFSITSFTPWEQLRSKERRVQLKEKNKKKNS